MSLVRVDGEREQIKFTFPKSLTVVRRVQTLHPKLYFLMIVTNLGMYFLLYHYINYDRMIMNGELGSMWKEMVLLQHLTRATKEIISQNSLFLG